MSLAVEYLLIVTKKARLRTSGTSLDARYLWLSAAAAQKNRGFRSEPRSEIPGQVLETFKGKHSTMKTLLCLMLLLTMASPVLGDNSRNDMGASELHLGVSIRAVAKVGQEEAKAAFKAWASTVKKERKLKEKIEIEVFEYPEAIQRAFENCQLNCVLIPTDELHLFKSRPKNIYLTVRENGPKNIYALLVNRNSNIENNHDLRGKKCTLYEGPGMALANRWLEWVMGETFQDGKSQSMVLSKTDKPMQGLLEVFFGQVDATLVDLATFELACQMNPQLRNNLKVLTSSPPWCRCF